MGLIGSRKVVGALALAIVVKSFLIAGLVASPVGPAPTLASGATGDGVDQPEVQGNGTSSPGNVTEGSSGDGETGDRCLLCGPARTPD